MAYIGNQPIPEVTQSRDSFVATSGQTTFTTSQGYAIGFVDVYLNGLRLAISDYTANDESTVVLASGANTGDIVDIIGYSQQIAQSIGTIAGQNYNNVGITGGTIDGTTIGGTTPGAGSFTTLDATGSVSSPSYLSVDDTNSIFISGGTSSSSGGNIVLFPDTHASAPGDINFRNQTTSVLRYDADSNSGTWEFNSAGGVEIQTGNVSINNPTDTSGYLNIDSGTGLNTGIVLESAGTGQGTQITWSTGTNPIAQIDAHRGSNNTSLNQMSFWVSSDLSGSNLVEMLQLYRNTGQDNVTFNVDTTASGVRINQSNTGNAVFIDQNGSGNALYTDGGNVVVNGGSQTIINSTAANCYLRLENTAATVSTNYRLTAGYVGISNEGFSIYDEGASYTPYWVNQTGEHRWQNTGGELMRLNSTGLGIGTSSPLTKLHVKVTTNQNLLVSGPVGISNAVSISAVNDANSANVPIEFRYGTAFAVMNAGAPVMYIDGNGDVGIGTTSPASKFNVSGGRTYLTANSEPYSLYLNYNSSTSGMFIGGSSTGELQMSAVGGGGAIWFTPSGEIRAATATNQYGAKFVSRSGGDDFEWGHNNTAGYGCTLGAENGSGSPYIGFMCGGGTTSNTYKTLGFPGSVIRGSTSGDLSIYRVATASADNQSLSGPTVTFTSGGDVNVTQSLGVGTAGSGTTGEIRATNNITAYYSDARLKNFEGAIPNALDKVKALTGYYFTENETAKSLGYDNPNRQVGLSAQEVEKVLPEIVTEAPISAEYKTIYYEKLIPLLVEAIKELSAKVDAK